MPTLLNIVKDEKIFLPGSRLLCIYEFAERILSIPSEEQKRDPGIDFCGY
jgi:hypothetical protein